MPKMSSTYKFPQGMKSRTPIDVNIYATRKTLAQGMMDIALLTANASQLKLVLTQPDIHEYFHITVVLISTSIVLQIIVGILLILVGRANINSENEQVRADLFNNTIIIFIFIITVINVLISAFGVGDSYSGGGPEWTNHADPRVTEKLTERTGAENDLVRFARAAGVYDNCTQEL
ncbi:ninjurin-2-like isoform X2 [Limulus polyphemus]|uniref:Ninjurin-2-like isoform X2 n=1 Tax=Limulus polyphemus TaxID=6850 RepID=A0ABM1BZY0_LIMPO|nr:ninjurin-2-like isoform X2 [Limulus polyphemus]